MSSGDIDEHSRTTAPSTLDAMTGRELPLAALRQRRSADVSRNQSQTAATKTTLAAVQATPGMRTPSTSSSPKPNPLPNSPTRVDTLHARPAIAKNSPTSLPRRVPDQTDQPTPTIETPATRASQPIESTTKQRSTHPRTSNGFSTTALTANDNGTTAGIRSSAPPSRSSQRSLSGRSIAAGTSRRLMLLRDPPSRNS
jgi:hypothetical protein